MHRPHSFIKCKQKTQAPSRARKRTMPKSPTLLTTLALFIVASAPPALAQAGAFTGKSVQMIIGFGVGGGYDLWGRAVGRHIGKHIPGAPGVIPQNMPGAGSYSAASYIYNVAPKDGS